MRSKLMMVGLCLLLVSLLLPIGACDGDECQWWAKTYGGPGEDMAYSIQETSDGGYIVAGYTDSFENAAGDDLAVDGSYDLWVLKINSDGAVDWQKSYGGYSWDYACSVQETSDGGYIVGGITHAIGTQHDFWVLKLDQYGTVDWQHTYGGGEHDGVYCIQETSDGGYIVAGYTISFGAGQHDFWVLKLYPDGTVDWQHAYGGTHDDIARSIQQTSDGGYIVAGETSSFGAGGKDFWVLKLDPDGIHNWQKTYGGTHEDIASSIQQTSDGGYIVVGETSSFGAGERDTWVLKLYPDGTVDWQYAYGDTEWDSSSSIQQTSDGGYIVAGCTGYLVDVDGNIVDGDAWVLKLDPDGTVDWQHAYGGTHDDIARSIQQTSDGGYIVAGETSSFGAGDRDLWVLKLDSNGDIPNDSECTIINNFSATKTDTTNEIVTDISPYAFSAVSTLFECDDTNITPSNTDCIIKPQCCASQEEECHCGEWDDIGVSATFSASSGLPFATSSSIQGSWSCGDTIPIQSCDYMTMSATFGVSCIDCLPSVTPDYYYKIFDPDGDVVAFGDGSNVSFTACVDDPNADVDYDFCIDGYDSYQIACYARCGDDPCPPCILNMQREMIGPDLVIEKTVDNPTPQEGDTITYTLTITNSGTFTATGVEVTDLLPSGVTLVDYIPSLSVAGNTYDEPIWYVGELASGEAYTLALIATVDSGTCGSTITNYATLTAIDQIDANSANNSACADITVAECPCGEWDNIYVSYQGSVDFGPIGTNSYSASCGTVWEIDKYDYNIVLSIAFSFNCCPLSVTPDYSYDIIDPYGVTVHIGYGDTVSFTAWCVDDTSVCVGDYDHYKVVCKATCDGVTYTCALTVQHTQ